MFPRQTRTTSHRALVWLTRLLSPADWAESFQANEVRVPLGPPSVLTITKPTKTCICLTCLRSFSRQSVPRRLVSLLRSSKTEAYRHLPSRLIRQRTLEPRLPH